MMQDSGKVYGVVPKVLKIAFRGSMKQISADTLRFRGLISLTGRSRGTWVRHNRIDATARRFGESFVVTEFKMPPENNSGLWETLFREWIQEMDTVGRLD